MAVRARWVREQREGQSKPKYTSSSVLVVKYVCVYRIKAHCEVYKSIWYIGVHVVSVFRQALCSSRAWSFLFWATKVKRNTNTWVRKTRSHTDLMYSPQHNHTKTSNKMYIARRESVSRSSTHRWRGIFRCTICFSFAAAAFRLVSLVFHFFLVSFLHKRAQLALPLLFFLLSLSISLLLFLVFHLNFFYFCYFRCLEREFACVLVYGLYVHGFV